MSYPELPLDQLKRHRLADRQSLVNEAAFARPTLPPPGATALLLESMPDILGARALRQLAAALGAAHAAGRPILWGMGGHVLKVGLSPLLLDLLERGFVQGLAFNGAGAIHDLELAMIGRTSEDVASALRDGSFGMAEETADFLNEAVQRGATDRLGFGESVGRAIEEAALPHRNLSLLAGAYRAGVATTVHVTLGADIVHMHASADGAAIGATSLRDFRRFAAGVATMQGGAYLNLGSAVTLPEVFLKAVSMARNLGHQLDRFTTANIDQIAHYRPRVNVLQRPEGGSSFDLRGQHEILLPLLRWLVLDPVGEAHR